jgi:hypothetical protein
VEDFGRSLERHRQCKQKKRKKNEEPSWDPSNIVHKNTADGVGNARDGEDRPVPSLGYLLLISQDLS